LAGNLFNPELPLPILEDDHAKTASNALSRAFRPMARRSQLPITQEKMKLLTKLLLILVISFLLVSYGSMGGSMDTVSMEGPKAKELFVYKTEKKFAGATVEILSPNGSVITSSHLQKRKLIIDFASVSLGIYTIRVSKGKETTEITYNKK
jgi:hypothetical protein